MVRLRDLMEMFNMPRLNNFNSKMVRLRAQTGENERLKELFQFQNGTIKSLQ